MSIHPIAGIDYGNGLANIDNETNIRYGVISLNSVNQYGLDDFEAIYPDIEPDTDNDDLFEAEPILYRYAKEGYQLEYSPDSSFLWVFKSPYVTECKFCSPCVPGAGDLNNPVSGGVRTYCLDSSWFDNDTAPYEYVKL